MATQMNKTQVLRRYFGVKEGQTLSEFVAELKELSLEERVELARLAAAEMGLSQDSVDFPLSAIQV